MASANAEPNYRILIAEDNPPDLMLIQEGLRLYGVPCDIDVVETGEEFLAYAQMSCHTQDLPKPDLILLDWSLPKGSGSDLIQAIRKTDRCANSFIIVLTSSISPHDRAAAEKAGANEFLSKPSDLDEFLRIGEFVKRVLDELHR
jgi:CheY-like chemotaxis protein